MKELEYKLVAGGDPEEINERVEILGKQGWRLYCGPGVGMNRYMACHYVQAMVRDKKLEG